MNWTPELKLKYLMGLSWTVTAEKDADEGYTILRVGELPSVIATGDDKTAEALAADFWEALQATLEAALEFDDPIALPRGAKAPWEHPLMPTPARNVVVESNAPNVGAYVPQPIVTGSPARVNEAPRVLAEVA